MEVKVTYTVEAINRPYGAQDRIPWGDAVRTEGCLLYTSPSPRD